MRKSLGREHSYRSALQDYPGGIVPARPTVSLVVPTYNEASGLEQLVSDIIAQDYDRIVEIFFVDGCSKDGTYETLLELGSRNRKFRVLRNSKAQTAAGINLAFGQATGDVVIRLDAHARFEPNVVRKSVECLLRTGAAGVGAIARPAESGTLVGRAIVSAHRSPFGVGVAKFRKEGRRAGRIRSGMAAIGGMSSLGSGLCARIFTAPRIMISTPVFAGSATGSTCRPTSAPSISRDGRWGPCGGSISPMAWGSPGQPSAVRER